MSRINSTVLTSRAIPASAINNGIRLGEASRQWANRPDDQRFLSLTELAESVGRRKSESWSATSKSADMRMIPLNDDEIGVEVYDPTKGEKRVLTPTNWGFNNLCQQASVPASYARQLPAELAAINLQYGLENRAQRPDALILAQSNGHHALRSITSPSYGRIWDSQLVSAVQRVADNSNGAWKIPAASYATSNPKRATTLYASDRDVFIFLVDDSHPIEIPGEKEPLFRGFYTWNSEVGAATFGICTFLYRFVCDNRNIWGATQVQELRIRHTGGAPERFAYEGAKYLNRYANEATTGIVEQVQRAKAFEIPDATQANGVSDWLMKRGFTKAIAKASVDSANAEEGQARSLWDIVQGITAHARTVQHTNERVTLEAQAGKLMSLVAA